jgi:DNA methylase
MSAPEAATLLIGSVIVCDWRELAALVKAQLKQVDALVVDAPYSARTHSGHDAAKKAFQQEDRRSISYPPWTAADVHEFVSVWSPLVRGWMVSITDDVLSAHWRDAYEAADRVAFAALPAIETGATDRKHQDGPASWTTNVMVGRPKGAEHIGAWKCRPYFLGPREPKPVIGGKPVWLIRQILEDYTKPDQVVVDPCCGGGTLGVAAKLTGRRWVQGDANEEHVTIARDRVAATPFLPKKGTLALFGGDK